MFLKRVAVFSITAAMVCGVAAAQNKAAAPAKRSESLPVTTANPQAAKLFEEGMRLRENVRIEDSAAKWRETVKADPDFAQAWAYLGWVTRDPGEEKMAREKAKALAGKTTPGEQLLIKWMTSRQENDFVTAIAAMNDLMAMYPHDKRLAFMAGRWLFFQNRYDDSVKYLERALARDPNYIAGLNSIAYAYSAERKYDKAIAALNKYAKLAPKEPNPQDSLGEINRLAGHYDEALKHYHESLKIDPKFVASQLGLGDTYAMMGQQEKARQEYAKAVSLAQTEKDKLDYEIQSAITYLRESKPEQATAAFEKVAQEAHDQKLGDYEAIAHRDMALYSKPQDALKHLDEAEEALEHGTQVSATDRDEQLARALKVRVFKALDAGDTAMAQSALAKLEKMAQNSRSEVIQRSYHAANGAVLSAKSPSEAIAELQEDKDDPFSMEMVMKLQDKSGDKAAAEKTREQLSTSREVLIEHALVVPKYGKG